MTTGARIGALAAVVVVAIGGFVIANGGSKKKVGNAVERNRVRRRLRDIVRVAGSDRIRTGHDYVLIGRRAALKVPFARIAEDFEGALRRVHAGRNGYTGSR
jgi:ribonuclease P protein component